MSSTFVQVAGGVGRKALTITALGLIGMAVGVGVVLLPPAIPLGVVGAAVLLLLWVMPELRAVPYVWSERMFPALLFVFTCVPWYLAIILPGVPFLQIRRVFLFAWLIPMLIVFAGSSSARQYVLRTLRASLLLRVTVLSFIAVSIITIPTSKYLSNSISYVLTCTINWYIPMFATILLMRKKGLTDKLFWSLISAVAINFLVGLVEYRLKKPFLIYLLPGSMREQIFAMSPVSADLFQNGLGMRSGAYRASSTFTTPLSWGESCAMILPMCVHFVIYSETWTKKLLGATGAVMCVASIDMSGSRGAYVGLIAGLATYSLCWSLRSTYQRRGSLAGKFGLVFCAMGTGATTCAVLFVGRIHRAVLGSAEGQASTDARMQEWAFAKPKIIARPLFGYGGGSAGEVIHYPTSRGGFSVDGYHMNLLVDYGIPGFLLFFSAFLIAIALCIVYYVKVPDRSAAAGNAIAASLIAFWIYRWTLSQPDSLTLAFILLGLTFGYVQSMREIERRSRSVESLNPVRSAHFT